MRAGTTIVVAGIAGISTDLDFRPIEDKLKKLAPLKAATKDLEKEYSKMTKAYSKLENEHQQLKELYYSAEIESKQKQKIIGEVKKEANQSLRSKISILEKNAEDEMVQKVTERTKRELLR